MKRSRLFTAIAGGVALSVAGFSGTALAQSADDVAIIVENLPGAVDQVVAGTQAIVDTYTETQSFEQTGFEAVLQSGGMLNAVVQGTEQFGMLPLGYVLVAGTYYQAAAPYLAALDDPSTAADLVNPDDLSTLLANLQPAIDTLQPEVVTAVEEGLQGNLTEGTGFFAGVGRPALVGNLVFGLQEGGRDLTDGTNYEDFAQGLAGTYGVAALATAGQVQQVEDALAPVFEAAAPVTEPLVAALAGL